MDRLVLMEWAGAGTVAISAGLVDLRLGLLVAGLWLIWAANFSDAGDDDADD